ncbi:MAG: hypothetical protein M3Y86_00570 [Verrucomicrobiota bacterium]|nr:hypothetical protein [Verrucomicrobiota bacterium]
MDARRREWRARSVSVATGGPAGASDGFLQIASDAAGPGSRLTVYNRDQWLGDYLAAGVTAIELDLRNSARSTSRFASSSNPSLAMGAAAYMTAPAILPVGSGWQHVVFSIAPANLIAVAGPLSYSTI